MVEERDELKFVVWRNDHNKWEWRLEKESLPIKGRNVNGVEGTFWDAYNVAKKRYQHESRKDDI